MILYSKLKRYLPILPQLDYAPHSDCKDNWSEVIKVPLLCELSLEYVETVQTCGNVGSRAGSANLFLL